MKKILKFIVLGVFIQGILLSCEMFERDNFDGPNSSITGAILDSLTNEPVLMDVQEGPFIQYIQKNYGPVPEPQNIQFFPDGTFENSQVFAGVYDFVFHSPNFVPIDTIHNVVFEKGKNSHLDIKVLPLHHIWDCKIAIEDNELVAGAYFKLNTVRITSEVFAYYTDRIAVFIDPAPYVGVFYNRFSREKMISWPILGDDYYNEIRIPLDDPDLLRAITPGEKYYVRFGVQTWASTAAGALFDGHSKFNYAPVVRVQF